MGTPITNLSFRLYRNDKGYDDGRIQELSFNMETHYVNTVDGVHTFAAQFTAPQDSSFGLEGEDVNAFRVGIYAKDSVNEGVILTLDTLEELISSTANLEDFSMKVRVKEATQPKIIPNWGTSLHNSTEFTASFIVYDQNNDSRLAGIDIDKEDIHFSLNGEPLESQDSSLIQIEPITEGDYPSLGKENGEVYKISYPFSLEEGSYNIGLTILDRDGNSCTESKSIEIKTSIPIIDLITPIDNQKYGKDMPLLIKGTVNTPSYVVASVFKKNGDTYDIIAENETVGTVEEPNGYFEKEFPANSLLDGEYKVVIKAIDKQALDLVGEVVVNVIIDLLAPRFLSVKFYPINKETNEVGTIPTTTFKSGQDYKIVIEVE